MPKAPMEPGVGVPEQPAKRQAPRAAVGKDAGRRTKAGKAGGPAGYLAADTGRQRLARALSGEWLGTCLLTATVVGAGVGAERLFPTQWGAQAALDIGAKVLVLTALIILLAPVSGAHLNPVVTMAGQALGARLPWRVALGYIAAQTLGAICGALLANLMFGVPQGIATWQRAGPVTVASEVVATLGLLLVIFGLVRARRSIMLIAPCVGVYVGVAALFAPSGAFINPAVTIGRVFASTMAGIAPSSAVIFVAAQMIGAAISLAVVPLLFPRRRY